MIEIYKCSRAWRQKSECGDFRAEIADTTRRVGNAELVSEVCSVCVGGNYQQKEREKCPKSSVFNIPFILRGRGQSLKEEYQKIRHAE